MPTCPGSSTRCARACATEEGVFRFHELAIVPARGGSKRIGVAAGVLRLDPLTRGSARKAKAYGVSILVDPDLRGPGIALEALRFSRRWQAAAIIVAAVLPGNDASAALFRSAGYVAGADGLLYSRPQEFHLHREPLSRTAKK